MFYNVRSSNAKLGDFVLTFMEPTPQPSLSADERQALRSFVSFHHRPLWQECCFFGVVTLLVVALYVGGQVVAHWAPGYWEARGFMLCSRHQTLTHGTVYLPDGPGFVGLFSLPATIGTGFSLYFAMVVFVFAVQDWRARRVAKLLRRILPDTPVA